MIPGQARAATRKPDFSSGAVSWRNCRPTPPGIPWIEKASFFPW
jgi:hypothetical protein